MISLFIISIYFIVLIFIFLYTLNELNLTIKYLKSKNNKKLERIIISYFPNVTIQLPVYNEIYVIERLIDSVLKIDWPKDKLEIQILDDSTDETTLLIKNKIKDYIPMGYDIKHIKRKNRDGFKAGALKLGTSICKGQYIAIFDADFIPKSSFLKDIIFHFENSKVGVVQTKWTHINRNYSILTRLQAYALDLHFTVEQKGRYESGYFMSFNGTAGIWRKDCILDAGGWKTDTLTEDLDLSYRAQLRGWEFIYREDVESPGELPVTLNAFKSQQFRWSKGAAECAKKILKDVLISKSITFSTKFNAFFHLMNSSLFICMILLIILSLPVLFIYHNQPEWASLIQYFSWFFISTVLLAFIYITANKKDHQRGYKSLFKNLIFFPVFLSISMGTGLYVSIGVIEGYLGIKSPFKRTPKFNITDKLKSWKGNKYIQKGINPLVFFEMIMMLYALTGLIFAYLYNNYIMGGFFLVILFGFAYTSFYSLKHAWIKET